MIKKIISLSLVLLMVLSFATIGTSATGSSMTMDNFETGTLGTINDSATNAYYKSAEASGLFIATYATKYPVPSGNVSIEEGMGYNGSTGLVLEAGASGGYAYGITKSFPVTWDTASSAAGDVAMVSFKMKFLSIPEEADDSWMSISHDYTATTYYSPSFSSMVANKSFYFADRSSKAAVSDSTIETGKWYTVVSRAYATSDSKRTVYTYILDEQGNVLAKAGRSAALTEKSIFVPLMLDGSKITDGSAKVVLDDVTVYDYAPATQKLSLDTTNTTLKNGATGVKSSATHTLVFDQYVAVADGALKLYKADDTSKKAIDITVSSNTNRVFFSSDEALDRNTEYVIDFSGVKNTSDLGLDSTSAKTLNFTTSNIMPPPILKSSSIADGTEDVLATTKSLTVTFDQVIDVEESVVCLRYGNNEIVPASISPTSTENEYIVSWTDDLGSKTVYTVDLSGVKNSTNPEPAGDSAKFSFTSELLPEYYYLEENFDSYADGTLGSKITGSALFNNTTSKADNTSVVAGAGFGGSTAIKVYSPNSFAPASTKKVELLEGETLFYEFKMNIHSFEAYSNVTDAETGEVTKKGESGIYILLGGSSYGNAPIQLKSNLISGTTDQFTYVIYGINDWKSHSFVNDEWYTVVYKATLGEKVYGYVYDKNGKLVCYGRSNGNLTDTSPSISFCGATSNSKGHDILYDDIKAYKVTNEKLASSADLGDVYAGATGVVPKDKHVIGFNQPLAINTKSTPNATANDIFSLYQGDTKVDAVFEQMGGNQIAMRPAKVLSEETTYTVKYEGLTSLSGNPLQSTSITFTTMDAAYPVGVVDSSLAISNGTVEAGDFTLTMRNREDELTTGDIVVAFYSDNNLSTLVGLKSFRNESFDTNREELSFTLDKDYENVGRIEIIMYDSISSFIPIMAPYIIE